MYDGLPEQRLDEILEKLEVAGWLERRVSDGDLYWRLTDKGMAVVGELRHQTEGDDRHHAA
jgi:DNA-binding PadR family transcriptional regulator